MHAKWVVAVAALGAAMPPAAASAAPGAGRAGAVANWTRGDKEGFGTFTTTAGKMWFTLAGGELSEVYAPDLRTPTLRDLQFVVSDGATFTERETDDAVQRTEFADPPA
jgi:glucoamylase